QGRAGAGQRHHRHAQRAGGGEGTGEGDHRTAGRGLHQGTDGRRLQSRSDPQRDHPSVAGTSMQTKSPVIIDLKFDQEQVAAALEGAFADREVITLLHPASRNRDLSGIDYAVVWKPGADLFSRAKDLKVVFSGGAGVDHVLTLPGLPDVPLVRFVDPSLTTRMSEWVVLQCLLHLRQHQTYEAQRQKRVWRELNQPEAKDFTVGIMGFGVLGQDAA